MEKSKVVKIGDAKLEVQKELVMTLIGDMLEKLDKAENLIHLRISLCCFIDGAEKEGIIGANEMALIYLCHLGRNGKNVEHAEECLSSICSGLLSDD